MLSLWSGSRLARNSRCGHAVPLQTAIFYSLQGSGYGYDTIVEVETTKNLKVVKVASVATGYWQLVRTQTGNKCKHKARPRRLGLATPATSLLNFNKRVSDLKAQVTSQVLDKLQSTWSVEVVEIK